MNKTLMTTLLLVLFIIPTQADEPIVKFEDSSDSFMRTYDESVSFGNISRGYFVHWSTYVSSNDDQGRWVELLFEFDSSIQKQKVYVIPGYWSYVDSTGYMKTWTNKVNVTVNPISTSSMD